MAAQKAMRRPRPVPPPEAAACVASVAGTPRGRHRSPGIITPTSTYSCPGSFTLGSYTKRDWTPRGHGAVGLAETGAGFLVGGPLELPQGRVLLVGQALQVFQPGAAGGGGQVLSGFRPVFGQ